MTFETTEIVTFSSFLILLAETATKLAQATMAQYPSVGVQFIPTDICNRQRSTSTSLRRCP